MAYAGSSAEAGTPFETERSATSSDTDIEDDEEDEETSHNRHTNGNNFHSTPVEGDTSSPSLQTGVDTSTDGAADNTLDDSAGGGEPITGVRLNRNSDCETAESVLGKETSRLTEALHEDSGLNECDIVILMVHGASFASSILANNLKDFLQTLDRVQKMWFWEIAPLTIHVEMIDWKSVLSPFQNKLMTKVVPVANWTRGTGSSNTKIADIPPVKDEDTSLDPPSKHDSANTLKGLLKWMSTDHAPNIFLSPRQDSAQKTSADDVMVAIEQDSPETGQKITDPIIDALPATPEAKRIKENITDFQELSKRYGHRLYFNNTIADVLCYMTPRFGNFMTNEICKLLNNKVAALRADPSGKFRRSKIVLVGHSLGSVILYELLTGLKCREVGAGGRNDPDEAVCTIPDAPLPPIQPDESPQINFPVSHFFMWGSPLGSFLLLQNRKELSVLRPSPFIAQPDVVRPDRLVKTRFYNIFHKSDPVAMRIEPIFYPHISELPLPVMLPNFKTNGDTDWRRGIDLVTDTSTIKAAATHVLGRLFTSNTDQPVTGMTTAEVEKYINADRYLMPDALNKNKRYGVTEVVYGIGHGRRGSRLFEGQIVGSSSQLGLPSTCRGNVDKRQQQQQQQQGRNVGPGQLGSSGSSEIMRGEMKVATSSRELQNRASFEVGKGDVGDYSPLLSSAKKNFMFGRRTNRKGRKSTLSLPQKPWTARQWALQLARRLRRRGGRLVEERLADRQVVSEVPKLREAAYVAINGYVEDFLKSSASSGSMPNPPEPVDAADRHRWLRVCREIDRQRTEWLCRKELNEELNREVSEEEIQGGDQLAVRLDFAVSESFQEFVLAPLGLLQSHLNYWSCNDTIMFMLKEMAGFRPRLQKERRDYILGLAQKARRKIIHKIEKLIPPPGTGGG